MCQNIALNRQKKLQNHQSVHWNTYYGRPLSVSGRPCYILPMFFFLIFLWPPYSPAQVSGSSRNFYTWWTLSVVRDVTTWIFFLVLRKLQSGPKSDEIWHIRRPRSQTFCSHARTRQNIVILKKNLLRTACCSTRVPRFGELWRTNPWDPRAAKFYKMTRVNRLGRVLFPFAECQHDHARTPYNTLNLNPLAP